MTSVVIGEPLFLRQDTLPQRSLIMLISERNTGLLGFYFPASLAALYGPRLRSAGWNVGMMAGAAADIWTMTWTLS